MKFVDIHCHILPGVDDGARNEEETREMLKTAYEQGTRTIVATPHYYPNVGESRSYKIRSAYDATVAMAVGIDRNYQICLGAEILYNGQVTADLRAQRVSTLCQTSYVLVEFPGYVDFSYLCRAVQNLRTSGFWPVIAHIERYRVLTGHPERVLQLVDMGARIQTNADAVCGKQGWNTKRFLHRLIRQKLVHVVATDGHGSRHRKPEMKKCADYITRKYGADVAERLCSLNPMRIVKGEYILE
ncbi:MAG: hypothetical protein PHG16_09495 [Lachnospiraceae bacterium]|nr:hypothetical protein [Lachnospiraceae bacterium]